MTKNDTPAINRRANKLSDQTSPYLLQHQFNPVDWYPWGEEALARARYENKPILLSIGYSACHWCHVMETESFEDQETATLMNESFVNIKVDREERPDLDDIYMTAVQLMTGHGGWPMTVFLTPSLKPFFGGTYFPPEDRHGIPSFKRIISSVARAWEEQKEKIEGSADELTSHIERLNAVTGADDVLQSGHLYQAVDRILQTFDHQWGGFGGAPKFPQAHMLSLAMRAVVSAKTQSSRRQECLNVVSTTLDSMSAGGMYDQVGGGFARYSVDRRWLVPHFEKMLYDNALLARVYLEGHQLMGREFWSRTAEQTLDFVLRELTCPEGAFYSSLDADSEGEEGKFYVWRPEEIIAVLGQEDGDWVNDVFGVTRAGNFEHGTSILHLVASPEELATRYGITLGAFWKRLDSLREKLYAKREQRVRPGRDEKVLTSWNGLMISSFTDGYRILKQTRYLSAARNAANFILGNLLQDNRLLRTWGRGKASLNGYLEDYSCILQALIDLAAVDFDPLWIVVAIELAETMMARFSDNEHGGFFFTSDDHEQLVTRPKSFFDGSIPSGTSVAVHSLLRLSRLTGRDDFRSLADAVLKMYGPHFDKSPDQFANMLCALDFALSPPIEIVLAADPVKDNYQDLFFAAHSCYLPNAVFLCADLAESRQSASNMQLYLESLQGLLSGKTLLNSKDTLYICESYACQQPLCKSSQVAGQMRKISGTPIV